MWKIIFIAITILLIIIGLLYFSVPKEDVTLEHWRTMFSGVTLISIFIAVANYLSNLDASNQDKQRATDKQLLDQSLLSLDWAYKALTDNAKHIPPKADRLNWLTTARHICRYKELSKEIKLNIYKVICSEHEKYWRHQFYLALDHKIFRSKDYFMNVEKGTNPWGGEHRNIVGKNNRGFLILATG